LRSETLRQFQVFHTALLAGAVARSLPKAAEPIWLRVPAKSIAIAVSESIAQRAGLAFTGFVISL